jgi:hypothetical protein
MDQLSLLYLPLLMCISVTERASFDHRCYRIDRLRVVILLLDKLDNWSSLLCLLLFGSLLCISFEVGITRKSFCNLLKCSVLFVPCYLLCVSFNERIISVIYKVYCFVLFLSFIWRYLLDLLILLLSSTNMMLFLAFCVKSFIVNLFLLKSKHIIVTRAPGLRETNTTQNY